MRLTLDVDCDHRVAIRHRSLLLQCGLFWILLANRGPWCHDPADPLAKTKTKKIVMLCGRRQLPKLGLGTVPQACFIANRTLLFAAVPADPKSNSKLNGVQIRILAPYSCRGMLGTAEDILHRFEIRQGCSRVNTAINNQHRTNPKSRVIPITL